MLNICYQAVLSSCEDEEESEAIPDLSPVPLAGTENNIRPSSNLNETCSKLLPDLSTSLPRIV